MFKRMSLLTLLSGRIIALTSLYSISFIYSDIRAGILLHSRRVENVSCYADTLFPFVALVLIVALDLIVAHYFASSCDDCRQLQYISACGLFD